MSLCAQSEKQGHARERLKKTTRQGIRNERRKERDTRPLFFTARAYGIIYYDSSFRNNNGRCYSVCITEEQHEPRPRQRRNSAFGTRARARPVYMRRFKEARVAFFRRVCMRVHIAVLRIYRRVGYLLFPW